MSTFTAAKTLPQGYSEIEKIDLVKNRKQMLFVTFLAIALALVTAVIGCLIAPERGDLPGSIVQILVLVIGYAAYVAGHEAVHGLFMWAFSHEKPSFGFSFTYAYAGSECYFAKHAYQLIALAPLVFWSIILFMVSLAVPADWFWTVWLIQIMNVGGAAGDLFVTAHLLRKPKEILVQDTGTAMTVYLK